MPSTIALLSLLAPLVACGELPKTEPARVEAARTDPSKPEQAPVNDLEFLRTYAETRRFGSGRPVKPTPTPDGSAVLFLRAQARSPVQTLFSFDVASGKTTELLTPEKVLAGAEQTLSVEERARLERQRISARGFTGFSLSKDGKRIVVSLSGRLYVVEREGGKVTALKTGAGPIDPHFSPDGTEVAYVRDADLYAVNVASNAERRITTGGTEQKTHGLAEFVAQEEMSRFTGHWWSPDGKWLAYEEADLSKVARWTIADPMHPEQPANVFPYPAAGKANAEVRLGVTSARGGKTVWVKWDAKKCPYLATVTWDEHAPLTVLVQNREQTEQVLYAVDPKSGATTELLVEKDAAWLNLDQKFPHWLSDGSGFLWYTERNGGPEVEQRGKDGKLVASWVKPAAGFRELAGLDEANQTLYFTGSPEPTESVLFRVKQGGAPERLAWGAKGPAMQLAELAEKGKVIVVSGSTDAELTQTRVFRTDGTLAGVLPSVAEEPKLPVRPEFRSVGPQKFRTVLFRPKDAVAGIKLPTIVDVYGGPTVSTVNHALGGHLLSQWLANQGFLVVKIDGRGTLHRGHDWERAVLGDFSGVTIEDQAAAVKALAAEVPEIDLARVGMTGWSFGGYMSALSVLKRPDTFKAAVAGAPVVDWADYDTHYTERYLKTPQANPEGYKKSSLLTYADKLGGALLLIHGTADDNVYFMHSLKLSGALFRAGKPHQLLPLSGLTHMVPDPIVIQREYETILRFFREKL